MTPVDFTSFFPMSRACHRLHYFPIVASVSWFSTLTILLLRWLSLGRPRYPGQINPRVPFISDMAAHQFKPVFITGCTLTSVCFVGTVAAVHHVRYSPRFYGLVDDAWWRKAVGLVALVSGLGAVACLLLLSIFDILGEQTTHWLLLLGSFGGLGLSAHTTEIVWWDQTWKSSPFAGLRKWCVVNNVLVACVTGVGVSFLVLLYTDNYGRAGIMEWTITYLGSIWPATFTGYVRFRDDDGTVLRPEADAERLPLLTET
ncbi:frag1/DRAM/Sfk1 family protein [Hirsutella rhossiliensis]|uniref:Frag1/DRAM/Sfk1 family domain-containing protein n=1 Tax=Hirsutella rhossiliensis TaxID=111463 RepID=A0A9P8N5J6_9HYPO|nr:frag1/DRAM/Sfk1 family domain-containing protein [Hirsutella rhossiliensis]KAH0967367.1 frag1/DRAM/Sfk1 family domain-containing protein [Hirsutella rhossiliensis]